MASAWGAWQCQYDYRDWRGGVNAWVVSETGNTATIRVEARYNSPYRRSVNTSYAYTSCDGSSSGWVGTGGLSQSSNTDTTLVRRSQDFTVSKTGSGRNVWCAGGVKIGGTYSPGTSEAGVNVWINARTYYAHGNPIITANKTTANYGESITLSWAKSATQGNANFDRFELWQGSNKLYSGSAISKSVKPSDVTGAKGGTATYTVKEIHTWYGSEKTTQASVSVTVRSGVVSVYDGSGNKHTGLVTAYDSSGKSHYVLITAYDADGSPHSVV